MNGKNGRGKISVRTNRVRMKVDFGALSDEYDFYSAPLPKGAKGEVYSRFMRKALEIFRPVAQVYADRGHGKELILAVERERRIRTEEIDFRKIGVAEIRTLPPDRLLRFLLTMLPGKSESFGLPEKPSDIYYMVRASASSVVTLRADVKPCGREGACLHLGVVNFLKAGKREKKPLYKREGDMLIPAERKNGKVPSGSYVAGNRPGRRTKLPFLHYLSSGYPSCKTHFYARLTKDIRERLGKYLSFEFEALDFDVYATGRERDREVSQFDAKLDDYFARIGKVAILLADGEDSEILETGERLRKVTERTLKGRVAVDVVLRPPGEGIPVLSVTLPKEVYEKEKREDPYPSLHRIQAPVQNVSTDTVMKESIVRVILKELAIKTEIFGGDPMIEHSSIPEGTVFYAILDRKAELYSKAFVERESMKVETVSEEEKVSILSFLTRVPPHEEGEYLVRMPSGEWMLCTRTNLAPLPVFEEIETHYRETRDPVWLAPAEICATLRESGVDGESEAYRSACLKIDTLSRNSRGEISSKDLMELPASVFGKKARNLLEAKSGRPLRFKPRNPAHALEAIRALYGIIYRMTGEKEALYHTGPALVGNLGQTLDGNSPFRRVYAMEGNVDLEAILPLMEVFFARNRELTVMPYPVKYARSLHRVDKKNEEE